MKRSLILSLSAVLAIGSASVVKAARAGDEDRVAACQASTEISTSRRPSFLGVEVDDVTSDTVKRLRLREERGALITRVIEETSAAKAGLKKDDVIMRWDGEPVESTAELSRHIHETPAGRTARLTVARDGSEINVDVTMGERTDFTGRLRVERARERVARAGERVGRALERSMERVGENTYRVIDRGRMGIQLQSMSPQLAEYFGLAGRNGALVVFVSSDSPASKAGIKAGDVIMSVAGEKTEGPGDVRRALGSKSEGAVEITVMRDRQQRSFTVQLEKGGSTSWLIEPEDLGEIVIPVPVVVPHAPRAAVRVPRITAIPPRVAMPVIAPVPPININIAPVAIPRISIPRLIAPKAITPLVIRPMKIRLEPNVL